MKLSRTQHTWILIFIIITSLLKYTDAQTNLALYKPAVESTSSKDGYYKPASNAVDGNPGTCAFADNPSQSDPAWWQVDLLEPYTVSSVAILFPNSEDDQYLQGFLIMISSDNITTFIPGTSICYTFYNTSSLLFHGVQMTFTCTEPIQGQYVTIIRNLGQQLWTVSLCEIVVTGSKYIELASHQPATEAKQYASRSAGLAVDGIATDCATTDPDTNGAAWWQVDLGATYTITSVTVTSDPNSAYGAAYLKNFYVYVSDSNSTNSFPTLPVCNSYSNQSGVQVGQQITVNCSQQSPVSGRYVTFKAKDTALTVCNVLVFGFNPNPITVTSPTTTATATATTTTMISTTTTAVLASTLQSTNTTNTSINQPCPVAVVGGVLGGLLALSVLINIILCLLYVTRIRPQSSNRQKDNYVCSSDREKTVSSLSTKVSAPVSASPTSAYESISPTTQTTGPSMYTSLKRPLPTPAYPAPTLSSQLQPIVYQELEVASAPKQRAESL